MKLQISDKSNISNLSQTIGLWAIKTTNPDSPRRSDLIRDKQVAVISFFNYVDNLPQFVSSSEVTDWRLDLEKINTPNTVYSKLGKLASYYNWLIDNGYLKDNPVKPVMPKQPKSYQNVKSLTDQEIKNLITVVSSINKNSAIRDHTILLFFIYSGMRRSEIISLKYSDLTIEADRVKFRTRIKGGNIENREIIQSDLVSHLNYYLRVSKHPQTENSPLWLSFDKNSVNKGKGVSSFAISKNFKRYAKLVGIKDFHLHRLRHTFSRILGEENGSLLFIQTALSHTKSETTKHYLSQLGTKPDQYSDLIKDRLNL